MLSIFIAMIAGISVVVARIINSNLANEIGTFQGTFFNNAVGLIFSLMFLLFSSESFFTSNQTLKSIPIISYLGGLFGVLVVILSNYVTPKISSFYLTLLIFIGQLFTGIIIDYLTLNSVSIGKIIGGLLVLMGLTYNLMIDKKISTYTDVA